MGMRSEKYLHPFSPSRPNEVGEVLAHSVPEVRLDLAPFPARRDVLQSELAREHPEDRLSLHEAALRLRLQSSSVHGGTS